MDLRKDDAYKNMIQNLSNKKLLAQIYKTLPYIREEIQQGKWVPSGYIWKEINPSLILKSWFKKRWTNQLLVCLQPWEEKCQKGEG